MPHTISELPRTLGELRVSAFPEDRLARRTVKDELRANLICKLQRREELFPGIVGYEDSVDQLRLNAVLVTDKTSSCLACADRRKPA